MDNSANSVLPPVQVSLGLAPIHYNQETLATQANPAQPTPTKPATLKVKGGPGRPLTLDRKRPYPCELCPSKFGSKMELEEHQNSHTGEKPFECDVCKARFNRRSTLWNHKRIHSDTKPFECPVCGMTFKWKNSLKCHKEMHLRKNEAVSVELDSATAAITYAGSHRKNSANAAANAAAAAAAATSPPKAAKRTKRKAPAPLPPPPPTMVPQPQPQPPPLTLTTLPLPNHHPPPPQPTIKTEPGLVAYVKAEPVGGYTLAPPAPPSRAQDLVGQSHSSILASGGQQSHLSSLLNGGGGGSLASSAHSNSSASSSGGYSPPSDPAPPVSSAPAYEAAHPPTAYFPHYPPPQPATSVPHYETSPHSGALPQAAPPTATSFYQPSATLAQPRSADFAFAVTAPPLQPPANSHHQVGLQPAPISLPLPVDYAYASFEDAATHGPGYTLVPSSFAQTTPSHAPPPPNDAAAPTTPSNVAPSGTSYIVKVLPYNEW